MQRCLELAEKGLGNTYPNPLVGSVIVIENSIIGEGWHQKAGTAHAEVNAISNVQKKELLSKSTLYVSLEPCYHFGKTPPCSDLIIKYKIPRVVIASTDPNPLVAGKGIEKLKKAGCDVIIGVLKKEADFLNRRFFKFHNLKRPYVILKWAQTEDHFIAPIQMGKSRSEVYWITNSLSKQRVHQWRSEEAAILLGVQTIVDDNPELTTRNWTGNNPLRIVIDPNGRTPKDSKLFSDKHPTLFFSKQPILTLPLNKEQKVIHPFSIKNILKECYKKQIQSIIIEGGLRTLDFFIKDNLWDEARVFTSSGKLKKGIKAPEFNVMSSHSERLDNDVLKVYFN
ncbi:MAG: diaminohydroxyphosphoribosylaminopyrimidine deaminase [Flavobacteriaceae bacterium]|jgi:diaminohydroxyphosphoribosylaminopyrimidine deaminase/5-amino-6-(5-phosphoribosylamino)uracil reductase|tara:strand:- start:397 stop:1413 length:1017 start_codon:yes stop_codon:yes gene_type:complete